MATPQKQGQGREAMIGYACKLKGERKRRKFGPQRPNFLSRQDLLDMDQDQLVGKILMRMTPRQFETRCTLNKVHFVLSDQMMQNPIWSQPAVLTLLGKGPKFIPKARSLSTEEVQGACARLKYRLVRSFERYINEKEHERKERMRQEAGIQKWRPKQRQLTVTECQTYVKNFFRGALPPNGGVWKGNQLLSPAFDRCICNLERDVVVCATRAREALHTRHKWPNLTKSERSALKQLKGLDVGFNNADKNYGPVVYSRELSREQCLLHLQDQKGTYSQITEKTKMDILEDIISRLREILNPFKERYQGAWAQVCDSIIRDAVQAAKRGRLGAFYIVWKLHKMANANGIRSRPIAAAIDYPTGPASHFLHCQLQEEVWKHPHVLRDSLDLIRTLEGLSFDSGEGVLLTSADVNALYPSIDLQKGMAALHWFMNSHTSFNQTLKDLCLKLAHFVLTNNFVECKELEGAIYHQQVGTAMGTSFSVIYAIIFMIWLETPIIERFRSCIQLYKRYIDDLFLIWIGSTGALCEFRKALSTADPHISLEWTGYNSQSEATDHRVVEAKDHSQDHFLDLRMALEKYPVKTQEGSRITYRVNFQTYGKPGNAYAYIPFNSFHGRHTFRGWVLAELLRLLTHSSSLELWKEEVINFYHLLRARGYPRWHLKAVFEEVTWERRSRILSVIRKESGRFFEKYRACVLTLRNAPEWPLLKERLDLGLEELVKSTFGDIFPPRVFLAQSSAPRLGSILKR